VKFLQDPANLLVHSICRVSVAALCQFGEGLLTARREGSSWHHSRRAGSADCARFVDHEGQCGTEEEPRPAVCQAEQTMLVGKAPNEAAPSKSPRLLR